MSKTILIVGTRKGAFLLESDEARRDWQLRGPFCEGWPIYHAIHDAGSGTVYAAAASEWHGSSVWRSPDLGETWAQSSEGLSYGEGEGALKLTKVSGLTAAQRPPLRRRREPRRVREPRRRRDVVAADDARRTARAARAGTTRRTSRPGISACRRSCPHPDDPSRYWVIVQGVGIFETTDDGASWTPRNRGLRADWPLENEEVGYCVHKLVMSPLDSERLYQQNHVGMHRSDDAGRTWTEITDGLPTEFGFAARRAPARPRHVLRDPARSRATRAACPTAPPRSGAPATRAASWQRLADGPPAAGRARRRTARGDGARHPRPARRLLRHEHGAALRERGRGGELDRDRELPAADRLGRGRGRRLPWPSCTSHGTLPPLFAGLPRTLDLDAATVDEALDQLEERWPGLRDRLCEPGPALRRHIHVYVDRERAQLDTALEPRSRVDVITAISGG